MQRVGCWVTEAGCRRCKERVKMVKRKMLPVIQQISCEAVTHSPVAAGDNPVHSKACAGSAS